MASPLRALRYPHFRVYLLGQALSFTGTWAQNTAMGWLVYDVLTRDSQKLAMVSFAGQIPTLLLGITVGVLVDRCDRRLLIALAQVAFLLQGLALVWLTLGLPAGPPPVSTYPLVLGLAFVGGMAMCLDQAARVAFVGELVPQHELSNAVALSSLAFNGARILGPVLAGWLVVESNTRYPDFPAFGEGLCFAFNALTNFGVLISLLHLRSMPSHHAPLPPPAERDTGVLGGLRYVRARPHLLALLVFNGAMAMVALPYLVLMPVYAKEALGGDARTLSHLMAAVGAGAIAGGMVMAGRHSIRGLATHIGGSSLGFCICIAGAVATGSSLAACLVMGVAGFFMVMAMIGSNTLAQTLVSREMRGRVLALFNMSSVGLMPLGSLLMGTIAKYGGIHMALLMCSGLTVLMLVLFSLRLGHLRRMARETPEYRLATQTAAAQAETS